MQSLTPVTIATTEIKTVIRATSRFRVTALITTVTHSRRIPDTNRPYGPTRFVALDAPRSVRYFGT